MKHIVKLLSMAVVGLLFSCSQTDLLTYDTTQRDGIYLEFDADEGEADSVFYNFGFTDRLKDTEDIYPVKAVVMGARKDYAREFKIEIISDQFDCEKFSVATEDYFELPETVTIPANGYEAIIPVKLLRHSDLLTKSVILAFRLVENDDFIVRGKDTFKITFDDWNPPVPKWWQSIFGNFTKKSGELFFKYFWASEANNPIIFKDIVDEFGYELEVPIKQGSFSAIQVHRMYFNVNVRTPMYNLTIANPEYGHTMPKPIY